MCPVSPGEDERNVSADNAEMDTQEGAASPGEASGEADKEEPKEDARKPDGMVAPRKPTRAEVELHELTHFPYRSWCRHCVRGRGVHSPHYVDKPKDEEERLPVVAADYGFYSDKDADGNIKKIAMLVAACKKTKAVMATIVKEKGPGDGTVVEKVSNWLNGLGHRKIVYKSDQENAIMDLWAKVRECKTVECQEMVPENSPKGDSQANGFIETNVREVKGMVRTIKLAVEDKIKKEIELSDATFQWIVADASCMLSRYKIGIDGQTAYERIKHKKLKMPIAEFGERVLCMPCVAKGTRGGDHEARYVCGVWLGIVQKSGEALIGNGTGVYPSTSIRRLPIDERWSAEAIKQVKATPWD